MKNEKLPIFPCPHDRPLSDQELDIIANVGEKMWNRDEANRKKNDPPDSADSWKK